MMIGFSTGCLYRTHSRIDPHIVDVIQRTGANAIELMVCGDDSLKKATATLQPDMLAEFRSVSIHSQTLFELTEDAISDYLSQLLVVIERYNIQRVVLHPDQVTDWDSLVRSGIPFAIENMDKNKERFQYIKEMKEVLERTGFPLVLDVNHCYTNDPSMKLANDFIDAFHDKIVEVHVSGYVSLHEPLYKTDQMQILAPVKSLNVPVIIESVFETEGELAREYEYVSRALQRTKTLS
jgi:hypothetical protein